MSIHLNQIKVAMFDWRLVCPVGSFITPGAFWGIVLLGSAVCATVVVDSSMPTPYCQDLRYMVCVEPRAKKSRDCVFKIKRSLFY